MSAQEIEVPDVAADRSTGRAAGHAADQAASHNEVRLVGRLGADPELRELPSGDTVWTLRVVVDRPPRPAGRERPRQRSDALECAVWEGRLKRSVATWRKDDLVEVSGALHRRFFQANGATASRVEVELARGRIIRRAGSG